MYMQNRNKDSENTPVITKGDMEVRREKLGV